MSELVDSNLCQHAERHAPYILGLLSPDELPSWFPYVGFSLVVIGFFILFLALRRSLR